MLAELGFTGLLVPEALGGAGPAPRECAVVLEELGRAVAPVPFLGCAVLAVAALVAAGVPAENYEGSWHEWSHRPEAASP